MANVPEEYEALIALGEAELAKVSTQKKPSEVLRLIYKELIKQFASEGGTVEQFNPYLMLYTAQNISKVLSRVQSIAKKYPPTHRKGRGTDGGVVTLPNEDWVWYFEGTQGGEGGTSTDDTGDEPEGVSDWAPEGEQGRARAMLRAVADETGFGDGDEPLPFVREVARRLGGRWGLNGKRGNANDISKDILAWDIPGFPPQLFDVLIDSGGENELSWQPKPYSAKAIWIAP